MKNTIFKTIFSKGNKGDQGDQGVNFEIPTNSVIKYDGLVIPNGFIETTSPYPEPPEPSHNYLYKWNFKKSLVDEINGRAAVLGNQAERTSNGVELLHASDYLSLETFSVYDGYTFEIDIAKLDFKTTGDKKFILNMSQVSNERENTIRWYSNRWESYLRGTNGSFSTLQWGTLNDINAFDNTTIKLVYKNNSVTLYINDTFIDTHSIGMSRLKEYFRIGWNDDLHDCIISAARVYENEE